MSVLFTDTDCEMNYTDAENLGIQVIGMPYTIKNEERVYDFGKNTNIKEFFDDMRKGEIATTSALNSDDYINYFEPFLKNGEDILYVHFSSELSGTFNYLKIAINILFEKYPDRKITCFDTKNISLGAGIQVIEAAKLKNAGASDEEIVRFLDGFKDKIAVYFYVESLQYLKRGGRVSAFSAAMGTMLNIKPILSITGEGKLEKLTMSHGSKKAIQYLYDKFLSEYLEDTKFEVFVIDADNAAQADELAEKIKNSGKKVKIRRLPIGPVIGAHAGPGTVGIVFVKI